MEMDNNGKLKKTNIFGCRTPVIDEKPLFYGVNSE